MRHSRRVRFLKRAIPLGAFLAVALVVGITFFNPFASIGGLTLGPVSVSGTRVVMDNPRLTGSQGEARPYEVTAQEASQDVREPHLVDLLELRARLTLDAGGDVARVEAATGRFDTQAELLELTRDVRVISTSGYTIDLRSASIDFKTGNVTSPDPVRVEFESGTIEADGMNVVENGKVVSFEGNVRSVLAAPALGMGAQGNAAGSPVADAMPGSLAPSSSTPLSSAPPN
ncbi:MAG TPA: LPS export ABC transporter periplasmic protein LptC [Saliniramus sp.]|nr:LPS export ABC transporter periplasmic protein LptC [Saliniramus sp.]